MIDEAQKGYISDKDQLYALFLSLGITFESEEEFIESILEKIKVEADNEEKKEKDDSF